MANDVLRESLPRSRDGTVDPNRFKDDMSPHQGATDRVGELVATFMK